MKVNTFQGTHTHYTSEGHSEAHQQTTYVYDDVCLHDCHSLNTNELNTSTRILPENQFTVRYMLSVVQTRKRVKIQHQK